MAQSKETAIVIISRTEWFSAAHRLHNSSLKKKTLNSTPSVTIRTDMVTTIASLLSQRGPVDGATGMINMELPLYMGRAFLSCLDHKHLDNDVAYFKDKVSTGENLIVFIGKKLEEELPNGPLYEVKMEETEKNWLFTAGTYCV